MMDDLVWYDITCHTANCEYDNVTIHGQGPKETDFMCGACGVHVTDWKVSERQSE
jgi:hypothetical protein